MRRDFPWNARLAPKWARLVLMTWLSVAASAHAEERAEANTFSIVAADPQTSEVGVAVATRLPAVGMYVPFAEAGVGAVASQAIVNPAYGPKCLELLRQGIPPQEILEQVVGTDPTREDRQLTIINLQGESAGFTGDKNSQVCGHRTGENFAVAGNLLATTQTLDAMAEAFQKASGRLSDRLLMALEAGDAAGGDKRGKQSAALLVVKPGAYFNGKVVDLRVDEHEHPIHELRRVYGVYMTSFLNLPGYADMQAGDAGPHIKKLNGWLIATGFGDRAGLIESGDTFTSATRQGLEEFRSSLDQNAHQSDRLTPAESHILQRLSQKKEAR